MSKKQEQVRGLSVEDQKWMAKRMGIDLESMELEKAADLFIKNMMDMMGSSILVDGKELNYDILSAEMIDAKVGLGFIDADMQFSREAQIANLAYGLMNTFLTDHVVHTMMKPKS